jgi:hypothetical protein
VPALRRRPARARVPLAAVRPQPLQNFKVPILRRRPARELAPLAAVGPHPVHRDQRAVLRGYLTHVIKIIIIIFPMADTQGCREPL